MKRILPVVAAVILAVACGPRPRVVVYGGTAAGVTAARSAAEMGAEVTLVVPQEPVGGMSAGGLGYTDIGNKQVVTGLAKRFYRQVGAHYGRLESWIFEPHVAGEILENMAVHPRIKVLRGMRLQGADVSEGRICSISLVPIPQNSSTPGPVTAAGLTGDSRAISSMVIPAEVFIDCSYEGDLMAAAGVSYMVGREGNEVYGETWNGAQMLNGHQMPDGIDPYLKEGDPSGGFLPGLEMMDVQRGRGDSLVQAYNYRICLTDSVENMIPISRPSGYDPSAYELLRRIIKASPEKDTPMDFLIWSRLPGRKTDINNKGGFSSDMIGANWSYPEADYVTREAIVRAHRLYTEGLLYFLGHDESVPASVREEMLRWGWCKDEFGGGLSPWLYVREARRMKGEYVCTQADCEGRTSVEDAVAMAAYTMDSHNCRRGVVAVDGKLMVKNEGNVEVPGGGPYPIPYRAITPLRSECTNLLVPVCLSASHIAYGSIRMEPVFMVLGQVAGMAAWMAGSGGVPVQEVDAGEISIRMEADPYLDGTAPDIIIDDISPLVDLPDGWIVENNSIGYGPTFIRSNPGDNSGRVVYHIPDGTKGEYALYAYQHKVWNNPHITYTVSGSKLSGDICIDLDELTVSGQTAGEWLPLGTWSIGPGSTVTASYAPSEDLPCKADALLLVPMR